MSIAGAHIRTTQRFVQRQIATGFEYDDFRGQGHGLGHNPVQTQYHSFDNSGGGAGSSRSHCSAHLADPATVSIVGAPINCGQPHLGTDKGPEILRNQGLSQHLATLDWRVEDAHDLRCNLPSASDPPPPPGANAKHCFAVGRANESLAKVVAEKACEGKFPLVLGGDHSVGIGSVAGALRARPDTAVLWVDAHADLNTPWTSPSGNIHGMSISFLLDAVAASAGVSAPRELAGLPLRAASATLPGFAWLGASGQPGLRPDQLAYVGLRDVDKGEAAILQELGIRCFTMHDVDRHGIGKTVEMALDHLLGVGAGAGGGRRPLHLSFDVDAVDPDLAPSTGTVVRGGLTYREAHFLAEAVACSGALTSMDMVEVNPDLGRLAEDDRAAESTAGLAIQIIGSALGNTIL